MKMKPSSAKKEFLVRLKQAGKALEALLPAEGVGAMLTFYMSQRAEGCASDEDGDMLLYQWGTNDWGDGEIFEFEITRQLIVANGEDDDIRQLSLTFQFKPTKALRELGEGNRWCDSPADVESFRKFIHTSKVFMTLSQTSAIAVSLESEGV